MTRQHGINTMGVVGTLTCGLLFGGDVVNGLPSSHSSFFPEENYTVRLNICGPVAPALGSVTFTASDDTAQATSVINPGTINVQEYFNEKLRGGVIDRIGQPIEGFVPFMFMQAFSGLVPKDFDGADALLGEYKIVEKELAFIMDEGGPIHSAAEAVSEEGMKTVLANIQRRVNVLITTTDEVDGLLLFLGAPLDLAVTECLPEQRDVDACIEIYQPVCALRDTGVRCVTTPCPSEEWEAYSNVCSACRDPDVMGYKQGECTDEDNATYNGRRFCWTLDYGRFTVMQSPVSWYRRVRGNGGKCGITGTIKSSRNTSTK